MSKILIITDSRDADAKVLGFWLDMLGVEHLHFHADELFAKAKITFFASAAGSRWLYSTAAGEFDLDRYDTVWLRRPVPPFVPLHELHPLDRDFAVQNAQEFSRRMWHSVCFNARWINPRDGAIASSSKFLQLSVAADIGLCIPDTRVTNDAAAVRDFVREEQTVCKQLLGGRWLENGALHKAYTAAVTESDLSSESLIQLVPAIYQRRITKAFDIRVVLMGEDYVAARISSKNVLINELDWRAIPRADLALTPCTLPSELIAKCRRLMQKLGISFGCADFVETSEGDFVFLEINEAGQFLWMDNICAELGVRKKFLQFLTGESTADRVDLDEPMDMMRFRDYCARHKLFFVND